MAVCNLVEKSASFLSVVFALILILCCQEMTSVAAKEDCSDRAAMMTRVQAVSFACGAGLIGKLPKGSCCSVLNSIDFECLCSAPGLNDSTYAFLRETFWLTWPLATTICGGGSVPPASCLAGNTPSTSTAAPGSPVADSSRRPPANASAANGTSASPATPESPPTPSNSQTPPDKSACSAALMGLFPCRDYVEGNSYSPSSSCCSRLSNVVRSQPQCLCLLLDGDASSSGININRTLALALPGACNVQTPPVSLCNSNGPSHSAAAPESPPANSSKTTTPSGTSNAPPPSAANGPPVSPATPESPSTDSSNTTKPPGSDRPSVGSDCTTTLMGLAPCLDYVGGNTSTPSPSCCSELSNVVQSTPQCLCLLVNGAASSYGININQTLALALPGVCNVKTPQTTNCDSANGPSASPAKSGSPPIDSSNTAKSPVSGTQPAANGPSVSPETPKSPSIDSSNTTKPPSSDTPSVETDCTTTLMGLAPCLDYVGGNTSIPSPSCCSELSNVVHSRPQCLCLLVNGAASSYGININQTLALALPGVCNVQTPHATKCDSANGPSNSPAKSGSTPPAANGPSASPAKPKSAPVSNTTKSSDSDTPSAQSDCTKTLMGLSPCLNYVTGNSSSPSAPCCSQLSSVVKSQPRCLCLLLNGTASSYGINVNQTLALGLPSACSVEMPPTSSCNSANGPSASPATPASPTGSSTPANPSVRIGPSENGASIGGRSNIVAVFVVFISAYALSLPGF